MPDMSEHRKEYLLNYAKQKYKRVPLDISHDKYDEIKAMSDKKGMSVNGYIKNAIDIQLKKDNKS